jgi:hypothetical protein
MRRLRRGYSTFTPNRKQPKTTKTESLSATSPHHTGHFRSAAGVDVVPTFTTSNDRMCLLLSRGKFGLLRIDDAERLQVGGWRLAVGGWVVGRWLAVQALTTKDQPCDHILTTNPTESKSLQPGSPHRPHPPVRPLKERGRVRRPGGAGGAGDKGAGAPPVPAAWQRRDDAGAFSFPACLIYTD